MIIIYGSKTINACSTSTSGKIWKTFSHILVKSANQ